MRFQTRPIGGNVVRNVLAEKGPACSFGSERGIVVILGSAITKPASPAERIQKGLVGGKRWQVGQQACVRQTGERRVDSLCAREGETMRVPHIQIVSVTFCNREQSFSARCHSKLGSNVRVL